jgi:hypothetical protein
MYNFFFSSFKLSCILLNKKPLKTPAAIPAMPDIKIAFLFSKNSTIYYNIIIKLL